MSQGGTFSLVVAVFFLVLWVVVWTICLIGWRVAYLRHAHPSLPSRLSTLPASSAPGVTIIRPICGLDDNLYNALQASMRFDYPKYQVIFALQDERDEAIPVVRMIMERYPDVDSRMIISPLEIGVNPKINNLLTPFSEAKYDLLWVIDSTISVVPGTLARAVDAFMGTTFASSSFSTSSSNNGELASTTFEAAGELEATPLLGDDVREAPRRGDVGLVHHVPYAVVHEGTVGSMVEMAFLNSTHAKMYLAINYLAIDSCVMGKSNLYSRTSISTLTSPSPTLSRLPTPPRGLAAFSPYLAEDNMLGLALWHQLGLKHGMTPDVALDFLGKLSLVDYIRRRVRWIRVRKRMTPVLATCLEPFTESIVCGLYGALAVQRLFGQGVREGGWGQVGAMWAVHMILWVMVDLSVRRSLSISAKPRSGAASGSGSGQARIFSKTHPAGGVAAPTTGTSTAEGGGTLYGVTYPSDSTALFLAAWAVREVLALPIFLYGVWGSEVLWRGRRYRVIGNGEAEKVQ